MFLSVLVGDASSSFVLSFGIFKVHANNPLFSPSFMVYIQGMWFYSAVISYSLCRRVESPSHVLCLCSPACSPAVWFFFLDIFRNVVTNLRFHCTDRCSILCWVSFVYRSPGGQIWTGLCKQ